MYIDANLSENSLDEIDILAKAVSVCESDEFEMIKTSIHKETENKKPAVDVIALDIVSQLEDMNLLQDVA